MRSIVSSIFILTTAVLFFVKAFHGQSLPTAPSKIWVADEGNDKYRNPVLFADYSDPDVLRVQETRRTLLRSEAVTTLTDALHCG